MKYLVRAAATALVSLGAATGALLPAAAATAATTPAAAPLNTSILMGTWTNTDAKSQSVNTVTITKAPGGGILVDAWGACVTSKALTPCEWGNVHAVVFSQHDQPGVDKTIGSAFRAEWSWDHGRAKSILAVNLQVVNGVTELSIDEPRIYSARHNLGTNLDLTEIFTWSAKTVHPTKNGTTVADQYPIGTSAKIPAEILGTWTPMPAQPGGYAKIVVSKDPNGTMDVHAWAYSATSTSVVKDLGTTYGESFGEGIGNTAGVDAGMFEAVAPYFYHDKLSVLCIELTPEGPMGGPALMVAEFTNYTPNGHIQMDNPANSNLNEMFLKN